MSSFSYRLGCAVPSYDNAQALAEGIRLFDEDAFVHIKESQDDDFWEIIALFNLVNGGKLQFPGSAWWAAARAAAVKVGNFVTSP